MIRAILDRLHGKAPKGTKRSSKWRKVRKTHIEAHPFCAVCLGRKKLEVHHKIPFHIAPELELDPENLMTLCESGKWGIRCHQLIGHLGNYKNMNINVETDAAYIRGRLSEGKEQ